MRGNDGVAVRSGVCLGSHHRGQGCAARGSCSLYVTAAVLLGIQPHALATLRCVVRLLFDFKNLELY
ncbi:hypothetical protein E2C01_071334 [Portunus trituberculatus]|uniref:Uncharacterized protein n=1 Tax=Portunus trituberculatus TaxID=210409 RepID=A0A5B7I4V2_PORTR|nr:hypothetical protein [Portunus trituberculatus]